MISNLFKKIVRRIRKGRTVRNWIGRAVIARGALVRLCPGKRHAWYRSEVGIIRKPLVKEGVA